MVPCIQSKINDQRVEEGSSLTSGNLLTHYCKIPRQSPDLPAILHSALSYSLNLRSVKRAAVSLGHQGIVGTKWSYTLPTPSMRDQVLNFGLSCSHMFETFVHHMDDLDSFVKAICSYANLKIKALAITAL